MGDTHAVVVGYLKPDRAIDAGDARKVGCLLRQIHDRVVLEPSIKLSDDEVYAPDDWFAQNLIVHGGFVYLVDLDLWDVRPRVDAVGIARGEFFRYFARRSADTAAFDQGYACGELSRDRCPLPCHTPRRRPL